MVGHITSALGYLARRGARERTDEQAVAELAWRERPAALPPGVELEWLGTSGFRIAYEGHTVLIDPYLTRLPLADVVLRRPVRPSAELVDRYVAGADAVLIGHTHFDHAVDAPLIAQRHGARVFGSRSMASLMGLCGLHEQMVEVEPYRVYEVGPFEITFVPSLHSKLVLGLSVPFDGDITCEHFDDLVPSAYGCGEVYGIAVRVAGVTFYHQGSADLIDDAIRHRGVDVFLAGIAGRRFTEDYLERILGRLEPRLIVPHHFDDFFRPLTDPMRFSFNVDFAGFADEVRKVSTDFEIRALRPLERIGGAAEP
jgi:L-ascorbate metabolism protein UlaG (beta-lactamase superfamily)